MTIIAAIALLAAVAFCLWMGVLYAKDIIDGHGQVHTYVFGSAMFFFAGMAGDNLYAIVSSWF